MKTAHNATNVLVFLCDQLRIDLLRCYGGALTRTPHIDSLAEESVVFDKAYTPCAICSPARASLMTGVYPHVHHMFNNSSRGYSYCPRLRPDISILPDWIADETCYQSAYFGKWHVGPGADLTASRFGRTLAVSHPDPRAGNPITTYAGGQAGVFDLPMNEFPDVRTADRTRDYLRSLSSGDKPFCLFCAFPGPHVPWMLPAEFGIRHAPENIAMWPNRDDSLCGKPLYQRKLRRYERTTDAELREMLACLFSYMELIDQQVGDVIAELRRAGLYENTMIVFTADHGDMAGAHGFLSKGAYMYEETYRIPMLVRHPDLTAAARRETGPVHLMDLTATLMHAMRGEPADCMATHSLQGTSLLTTAASARRTAHYGEYHGDWYGHYSSRMVTDGRWKLVWNFADTCELYELHNDPGELTNRFYEDACRPVCKRYFDILTAEARRLEDTHAMKHDPAIEHLETHGFPIQTANLRQHG